MVTIVRRFIKTSTLSIAQNLARVLSLSRILGSWNSYFSLNHAVFPAFGYMLSRGEILAITLFRTVIHLFFYSTAGIAALTYHLPSLAATGYIHTFVDKQASLRQRLLFTCVLIACIVTFTLHPVGSQAWAYSAFWVLPLVTVWFARKSLLAHALGATFTAHAVGSVLFLLCTPTVPLLWITLIPRVIIERTVFALGITGTLVLVRAYAQKSYPLPA